MGLVVALGCGGLLAMAGQGVPSRPPLQRSRMAASDLEVAGIVPGRSRFVSREFLLSLPQVTVHIESNEDFPAITKAGLMVRGVYLDVLAERLGARIVASSAVEAVCIDRYAASYPAGYIWIHRPILVLTIQGLSPHEWSIANHGYDAGPYFIAYEHFQPHFKVLSHEDRALEPDEVNELRFTTKAVLFAGIEPKEIQDPALGDSPVVSGFRIARENCFRCHNSGQFGGSQAGVSWQKLGKIARKRPDYFSQWTYDPKTIDPKARMPGNPQYDKATLDAITKYFAVVTLEAH